MPVCGPDTAAALREEADDVLALHQPRHVGSVSEGYADFHRVPDEEVLDALREPHPA